jgi:hypothetical protein
MRLSIAPLFNQVRAKTGDTSIARRAACSPSSRWPDSKSAFALFIHAST